MAFCAHVKKLIARYSTKKDVELYFSRLGFSNKSTWLHLKDCGVEFPERLAGIVDDVPEERRKTLQGISLDV